MSYQRTVNQSEKCFACGRRLGKVNEPGVAFGHRAITTDGQMVFVGTDCHAKIVEASESGFQYQPPKGGPKLIPWRG